jgi:hypothetical protein
LSYCVNQFKFKLKFHDEQVLALSGQFARARNELEKSETARQGVEYELSVVRCGEARERRLAADRERLLAEAEARAALAAARGAELEAQVARLQGVGREQEQVISAVRGKAERK